MKKYNVIYADPPWSYKAKNPPCLIKKQPLTCSVDYYYQTMSYSEIKAMPIKDISERNSVLFLWATTPNIEQALSLVGDWGFKYKTMITWEKINRDCMGYWFRVCTEHLIVAVRGSVKSFRSMERTCYREARGKHSKKPDYFYGLIESVTKGERLELFARNQREGWDVFGNQVNNSIKI
jgi:N6-adenosine-specific RNA methylase IME4